MLAWPLSRLRVCCIAACGSDKSDLACACVCLSLRAAAPGSARQRSWLCARQSVWIEWVLAP
jgi:hypothetical protein